MTPPPSAPLSPKQSDLLRDLIRRNGPILVDHLDLRVLRSLESRALVDRSEGWVSLTQSGREYFESNVRRRRKTGRSSGAGTARAEAIIRAVEMLEQALPRDAEMMVGDVHAYADDVVAGLRALARELQRRSGAEG
ncbi:MAG: hypothetical protein M3483_01800 [Gemmatimonadota bacterium]|nr:hypothetical protein [Gemmatimonadota bacterium]